MVDLILRVQYVFVIPGLHLILNINQAEYIAGLGDSAGARIVIHHQSRMPHPEDDGIALEPGVLTSIGLRHVSFINLNKSSTKIIIN